MRFLFVDAQYPAFLDSVYRGRPQLRGASYASQLDAIHSGLFGEAAFQAQALRDLGHEADVVVTNAHAAQHAWAIEHGQRRLLPRPWGIRLRRGFVPWPTRSEAATNWDILLAQAREYRPDVIYVEIMNSIPVPVAMELRAMARLTLAQIAVPVPDGAAAPYDLILSSIPSIVAQLTRAGSSTEWVPLAFEPSVLKRVPARDRDVPVSFVGSIGASSHPLRQPLLEAVADVAKLHTWTADRSALDPDSPVQSTIHGPAFGRAMYEVLARSRLTLNSHAVWAGPDANNLRLYEATGMGALLITDDRKTLNDLFAVGTEVVAYRSPDDAAELVRYFLEHPAEAAPIAAAGQARTLRDHTWLERMATVTDLVRRRL